MYIIYFKSNSQIQQLQLKIYYKAHYTYFYNILLFSIYSYNIQPPVDPSLEKQFQHLYLKVPPIYTIKKSIDSSTGVRHHLKVRKIKKG